MITVHLAAGWTAMGAGLASGILLGLFFHEEAWLGGYASHRRRLLRLGHVACFGLGLLQIAFAATLRLRPPAGLWDLAASTGLLVALPTMPLVCLATARRPAARRWFPLPVGALAVAIVAILGGFLA